MNYSIIIPTYNSQSFIYENLVEIQEEWKDLLIGDIEWIIVDDGSEDSTLEELLKLKTNINFLKIFRLKKNTGQFTSTNFGLWKSEGQTIITIDDDLKYHPRELNNIISCTKSKENFISFGYLKGHGLRLLLRRTLDFFANKKKTSSYRYFDSNILPSDRLVTTQLDVYLGNRIGGINYFLHEIKRGEGIGCPRVNIFSLLWFYFRLMPECDGNRLYFIFIFLAFLFLLFYYIGFLYVSYFFCFNTIFILILYFINRIFPLRINILGIEYEEYT